MTVETLYVALPFKRSPLGHLSAQEALACSSSEQAAAEASKLGLRFGGAVAFARRVDRQVGVIGEAELIYAVGDLPRLDYLLGTRP